MATVMESTIERDSVVPEQDDLQTYQRMEEYLRRENASLTGPEGEVTPIPLALYRFMRTATHLLASNHVVLITAINRELTTQQAALYLGVSRPTLVKLLEDGAIPYTRPNRHRRITFADLKAYRDSVLRSHRDTARELTQMSEEMGGYEVSDEEIAAFVASTAAREV